MSWSSWRGMEGAVAVHRRACTTLQGLVSLINVRGSLNGWFVTAPSPLQLIMCREKAVGLWEAVSNGLFPCVHKGGVAGCYPCVEHLLYTITCECLFKSSMFGEGALLGASPVLPCLLLDSLVKVECT